MTILARVVFNSHLDEWQVIDGSGNILYTNNKSHLWCTKWARDNNVKLVN